VNTLVSKPRNGRRRPDARDAIANQIDQIRQSLIGLANTQYDNRPLFGGTTAGRRRLRRVGQLRRHLRAVQRTIAPGVQVQVNVNGDSVFGSPGNDLFSR
jgi:flagellar hook-associated protein 3 FlgL